MFYYRLLLFSSVQHTNSFRTQILGSSCTERSTNWKEWKACARSRSRSSGSQSVGGLTIYVNCFCWWAYTFTRIPNLSICCKHFCAHTYFAWSQNIPKRYDVWQVFFPSSSFSSFFFFFSFYFFGFCVTSYYIFFSFCFISLLSCRLPFFLLLLLCM